MLKVLIDIGHPAHVHLFKHFAWEMQSKGHAVLFTCRDKEFEIHLLSKYGFKFINFGKKYKSTIGKLLGMIVFDFKEFKTALNFKPDIFLSHGSIYAAHASWCIHRPHISLEDSFNFEQIRLYLPFTKAVLTSDYEHPLKSLKVFKYAGYHELAYLHPNVFTPDPDVLKLLNIQDGEKYYIVRFVSWNASHDIGQGGLTLTEKKELVRELLRTGKVFISSEGKLESSLEEYRFNLPPEQIHNAMAYAHLFVGEGVTMASECAVLGTKAVYVNSLQRGYTTEQENDYNLVCNFTSGNGVIDKVKQLISDPKLKDDARTNRDKLLSAKIDVTAFLVWFVENYPESCRIMKENPDYQYNFK
jgi:predicted glycosyltransferase